MRPRWSLAVTVADNEIKAAQKHMSDAFGLRCKERIGAREEQCTADAEPQHTHRHNKEELPW